MTKNELEESKQIQVLSVKLIGSANAISKEMDIRFRVLSRRIIEVAIPLTMILSKRSSLKILKTVKLFESIYWFSFLYCLPERIYSSDENFKMLNKNFDRSRELAALEGTLKKARSAKKIIAGFLKKQKTANSLTGSVYEAIFPIAEMTSEIEQFELRITRWKNQFKLIEKQKSFQKIIIDFTRILGDRNAEMFLVPFKKDLDNILNKFRKISSARGVDLPPWREKISESSLKVYIEKARPALGIVRKRGQKKK